MTLLSPPGGRSIGLRDLWGPHSTLELRGSVKYRSLASRNANLLAAANVAVYLDRAPQTLADSWETGGRLLNQHTLEIRNPATLRGFGRTVSRLLADDDQIIDAMERLEPGNDGPV